MTEATMNSAVEEISQRMTLRDPQRKSLEILRDVLAKAEPKKDADLKAQLASVQGVCPSVKGFDRDFLSLCFALATGVGKTRLMGAFIAYLHRVYGWKTFVVIAPNLTIYDKLVSDFSDSTSPKYVFRGISEFASTTPTIITGDTYQTGKGVVENDLFDGIVVNIFNIAKLTAKEKGHLATGDKKSKVARIRRICENIGESYFEYLAKRDDLVVIMDESHHYRAEAGASAINELKPVLGLELTATPKGFNNVAYEFTLGEAIAAHYVKSPCIATRKGFVASNYKKDSEELERLKLNDGIHIHELTKLALSNYAHNHPPHKPVKPFMMVVTSDKKHADEVEKYLRSSDFRKGAYADKIVKVYSDMGAEATDKMVGQLLEIEKPGNPVEIVIHVNMLSEGWDVTNLYTIVPLRKANSELLVEQSIGRGLRLPYGEWVEDEEVNQLTIVSHDNYAKIVNAAREKKLQMFQRVIGEDIPTKGKKVVPIKSAAKALIEAAKGGAKGAAEKVYVPEAAGLKPGELTPEFALAMEKVKEVAAAWGEQGLSCDLSEAKTQKAIVAEVQKEQKEKGEDVLDKADIVSACKVQGALNIAIPKIWLEPKETVLLNYAKFNLDTSDIPTTIVADNIKVTDIVADKDREIKGEDAFGNVDWCTTLLHRVREINSVCYEDNAPLIAGLVKDAVDYVRKMAGDEGAVNVLRNNLGVIAENIARQLAAHARYKDTEYDVTVLPGYIELPESSVLVSESEKVRPYDVPIPKGERSQIKGMVFGGFSGKCLYKLQKFDSEPERGFSVVLEKSKDVIKWFRPSGTSFAISWRDGNYEPDFIVETKCGKKYVCEVKAKDEANAPDVVEKMRAAVQWCAYASQSGEKWGYVFVTDDLIDPALTFDVAVAKCLKKQKGAAK